VSMSTISSAASQAPMMSLQQFVSVRMSAQSLALVSSGHIGCGYGPGRRASAEEGKAGAVLVQQAVGDHPVKLVYAKLNPRSTGHALGELRPMTRTAMLMGRGQSCR
jgi:hypothetical protein